MGQVDSNQNKKVYDLLAEAKAIKNAVIYKAISYEEAKTKAEALLEEVNTVAEEIARKHGQRYKKLQFPDI